MNRSVVLLAAFIAGMASLMYEVAWSRPVQLIYGSTSLSVSTIVAAFIGGLAIGSFLFRKIAENSENTAVIFAVLEFLIGIYGLLIIFFFPALSVAYISLIELPFSFFLLFLILFVLILMPSTLIGCTWPLMNKMYIEEEGISLGTGKIYAANSFGSGTGALLAGIVIIPAMGIKNASFIASYMNIFAAVLIVLWQRRVYG